MVGEGWGAGTGTGQGQGHAVGSIRLVQHFIKPSPTRRVPPLPQSKLASLAAEAQAQKAAFTSELRWAGEVYPVREEKIRIPLHAAQVGGGAGCAVSLTDTSTGGSWCRSCRCAVLRMLCSLAGEAPGHGPLASLVAEREPAQRCRPTPLTTT